MNPRQTQESYRGYYPDAELVLALVCPVGTAYRRVVEALQDYLGQFKYKTNVIHLSEFFEDLLAQLDSTPTSPSNSRFEEALNKIKSGNRIRELPGQDDILALVAASLIANQRLERTNGEIEEEDEQWQPQPLHRMVHIVVSLKRPEEVDTLRRIYGSGFFLIGVSASKEEREQYLAQRGIRDEADQLIETDASQSAEHGQQTRETFHLADVFTSMKDFQQQIPRFLDLLFGCPSITPTVEEQAMFTAYGASLRSGDLSRQVGAAILDPHGDLLGVGCNEAPKVGGGLYGPEVGSKRDIELGEDSNEMEKRQMAVRIMQALGREETDFETARKLLKPTGFLDITEFGRAVHAEMEALSACTRSGRSVRDATLFTTTFPCHNCCRHIIGMGIRKVIYIEPYAKSKAPVLHKDEISIDREEPGKLPFLPFLGVGPRRYFDLFSLKLSTGYPVERKQDGKLIAWQRSATTAPRLQLQPSSYLLRELLAWKSLKNLLSKEG
ncbi:MAG: anti-phage dCTP deaminase [Bryobacteraceae bacterium]